MIRLFVTDIDGCLARAYTPYRLDHFGVLAEYARRAGWPGNDRIIPALSVCSGRAYPYVEAVTQALGILAPVLFESGGGMFDPITATISWNPGFTEDSARQLEAVKHWFVSEVIRGTSMSFDYGKRTQAGIIGPDPEEISVCLKTVESFVSDHFPDLRVFHTDISIDVSVSRITKREAIHWLADVTGVKPEHMAYIGDTHGDICAMEEVGYAFAPANAAPEVRSYIGRTTRGAVSEGVVEAFRWCIGENDRLHTEGQDF